nr:hypothetical protein [Tanacetum cinerariifolium]
TNVKELWRICKQYGNVIDVFIPNRKSKSGVPQKNVRDHGLSNSYLQSFKSGPYSQPVAEDTKLALVLDDTYIQKGDFSLSLVGKLKDFGSLPNLKLLLKEEGFTDITIHYMVTNTFKIDERVAWIDIEGVLLCVCSHNTFVKISSKWGSLVFDKDNDAPYFHRKRLCIKTSLDDNIFESFKIIDKDKILWIRAKEVSGWVPNFNTQDDLTDFNDEFTDAKNDGNQKNVNSEAGSEVDEIPNTIR